MSHSILRHLVCFCFVPLSAACGDGASNQEGTLGNTVGVGGATAPGGTTSNVDGGGPPTPAPLGGGAPGTGATPGGAASGGLSSATNPVGAAGSAAPGAAGADSTGAGGSGMTGAAGSTSNGGTTSPTDPTDPVPPGCPVQLEGWAAVNADGVTTTTGGGNATAVRATSAAELADLAGDGSPRVIEISGTLDVGLLEVASNKTLIGIGNDATLEGGISIVGTADANLSNVIVRNLTIVGRGFGGSDPGDTFAVRFAHHVWIDHCNILDGPDGNLDITRGANYVTVSWSRFWYTEPEHDHRLSSLVGGGADDDNRSTDEGKLNVTWHHNWWAELVQERMPRVLFGQGHIYNNYYTSSGNNYCIRAGADAGVLIENNYFLDVSDPHEFADDTAHITATGNVYVNTSGVQETGGNGPAFPTPPYGYTLGSAADVPTVVSACVGPR